MVFIKNIIAGNSNRYFSGKAKKIAIVSIVSIITVSYGLFFYLQNTTERDIKNSIFEQHRQRQIESTKGLSQNIGSNLDSIMARLQMLANSAVLQQVQLSGNDTRMLLEEVYHQIPPNTPVDRLFILDNDNIVKINIVPKGEKTFVGRNISYLDWVGEATAKVGQENKALFSNGYSGSDGKYRIVLTYPILNRQTGDYIGLVGVAIPTASFFAHYGNIHDINSQFLVVYDKKATLLAVGASKALVGKNFFEEYTQNFVNHNPVLNNLTRTLLTGNSGYGVYDYGRGERLTTQYPIIINGQGEYFVQVVTPTAQIYSQINDALLIQRVETFILLAGTTAAIVVLIIFLIKWNNILNNEVRRRTVELEGSNQQLALTNEKLKVHDKIQKEFINIASHEIRTPTQAIIGLSDLLQTHPEKRDEMVKAISRNASRLQRLTNDILDVTKIESRTLNLNKEKFNLSDLIASVIEDHRSRIEKENSKVKLLYNNKYNTDGSPVLEADRDRITQVISNILGNAIKFTSNEGGTISVTLEKNVNNQEEVIATIRDTGEGIHHEILPRLFTKFATKSFTGTGLGLYISKSIIEAHGGKMWAQNNSDGQGATFTFTLPLNNKKSNNDNEHYLGRKIL